MSLVERALKKLQESRAAGNTEALRPAAPIAEPRPAARGESPVTRPLESVVREAPRREPPARTVNVDKAALRALDLLPPLDLERQIANQYQQIKRPLVASVTSRPPAFPNPHLIMLASALPGEGKTFTSINLALSMALEKDIEVLLIDADVAKPHVSDIFGLQHERGLLDLLVDRNLSVDSLILPTNVPGLSVLPAGKRLENATELLASSRMREITAQLSAAHGRRIVLFDSPPLLLSTESRALVHVVGQVVLVVRAEFTAKNAVMEAIAAIGEEKPISLILNQSSSLPSAGYYGYGSYGDPPPKPE